MRNDVISEVATGTQDEVDDALRQTGFFEYLDEADREQRGVRRRFEHDGVTEDECRHDLPGRDRERKIPWRDRRDDTHRVAHAHRPLVGELRRDDVAELAAPLAGDVIGHVDALLDVAARFREHLAHLASHLAREVVLASEHDLAGAIQDLAALGSGVKPPAIESAPGRIHRAVNVCDRRLRDVRDQLAGRGVGVLERSAAGRVEPPAVDVVLERGRRHP